MPYPKLPDETLLETVAALDAAGGNVSEAARVLRLSRTTVRRREHLAALRGLLGTRAVLPGFEITKTSEQLGPDGELQRQWVQQEPAPGADFEVPPGHVVKGVSAYVDAENRILGQWIKTREDLTRTDLLDAIEEVLAKYRGQSIDFARPAEADADLLNVVPVADQHHGLLAWGRETGGENYDLEIGAERLRTCARALFAGMPAAREALILGLGDYLHQDDQTNATPRSGHVLDVDGRFRKVLRVGFRLKLELVDMALQRHELVRVKMLPGNHDPHASAAISLALAAHYEGNARVIVDDNPGDFFFHRHGAVLIGANHGHRLKPVQMAQTMAVQRQADWGETLFKHFFFGHIHHERAQEVMGVRCESFQTLVARDAHAAGGGYHAGQSFSCVTFHRETGERGRQRINIPPLVRPATRETA